jgi:formylglycine-generating enzyme required for sulfatase activity
MPKHAELSGPFGRYTILRKLGEGGMGAVYLAEDPLLGRRVALKVPLLGSPEVVQRFLREARAAAAVDHSHVCPVHDVGCVDGVHYLTMPFIEGQPLTQLLDGQRGLPVPQAVGIVHTLALALHERGLMHRDLKPANVMLRHGKEPVLMDFGLARGYADDGQRLTSTGAAVGTPAYMSPEQINGDPQALGPATDSYSLGVILFELLTGRRPFDAPGVEQLYFQIFQEERPKPSQVRPDVPPGLDAVCLRALAKKPGDRFTSMAEYAGALAPWLGPPTPSAAPAVPPPATQRIACPHCRKPLKLTAAQWGQRLRCPACGEAFTVSDLATLPRRPPGPPGETLTPVSERTVRRAPPQPFGVWLLAGVAGLALVGWVALGWLAPDGGPGRLTPSAKQPVAGNGPGRERRVAPTTEGQQGPPAPAAPGTPATMPRLQRPNDLAAGITNSIGMKLVLIPAGTFMMGSPETEWGRSADERPHEVAITRPFYLGVYEVTQAEYQRVIGHNPSWFCATGGGKDKVAGMDTDRFPVENVSWNDAFRFCRKLSELPEEKRQGSVYRLPTEAEWEYACRAGAPAGHPFHFGPSLSSEQANFDGHFPYGVAPTGQHLDHTTATGSYPANAFGLHDMHGNVWEWCADWHEADYYKSSPREDPSGPGGGWVRVLRGGCWADDGRSARAAFRLRGVPTDQNGHIGFRVALVPSSK